MIKNVRVEGEKVPSYEIIKKLTHDYYNLIHTSAYARKINCPLTYVTVNKYFCYLQVNIFITEKTTKKHKEKNQYT